MSQWVNLPKPPAIIQEFEHLKKTSQDSCDRTEDKSQTFLLDLINCVEKEIFKEKLEKNETNNAANPLTITTTTSGTVVSNVSTTTTLPYDLIR